MCVLSLYHHCASRRCSSTERGEECITASLEICVGKREWSEEEEEEVQVRCLVVRCCGGEAPWRGFFFLNKEGFLGVRVFCAV